MFLWRLYIGCCLAVPVQVQAQDIFRVWTPVGRPVAAPLPLTDAARSAAYDALADGPALKCVAPGMPAMLDTPYPIEFVDQGDRILMRYEEWHGQRIVYMNPANGPAVQAPSAKGVSFGRWNDTTLEIFTLYIDYPYFDDLGTPQSESVTVFERYVPNETYTRLDWEVSVTDAATFTMPVAQEGYMTFEPGERIKPFTCELPK